MRGTPEDNLGDGMRIKSVALMAAAAAAVATPLAVMAAAAVVKLPLTSTLNKPFPGKVGVEDPFPPVHTPAQELATFTMPPGYQVQLVASDPLIEDPMIAEFDGDGRLWVLEEQGWGINANSDNTPRPGQ